jgi:hypothetical protein
MDLHALLRELRSHRYKVPGNIHWILEGHARVIAIRAQITILHAQLPDHSSEPLLTGSQVGCLVLSRVEVCWQGIAQLFL